MLSEREMAEIVETPELARIKIGCHVAVRWPNDGRYYPGTVSRERNTERPFCVAYDAGGCEWVDFHKRKFQLRRGAELSSACSPGKVASQLHKSTEQKYAIGTKLEEVGNLVCLQKK
jgi:hypothetical protein